MTNRGLVKCVCVLALAFWLGACKDIESDGQVDEVMGDTPDRSVSQPPAEPDDVPDDDVPTPGDPVIDQPDTDIPDGSDPDSGDPDVDNPDTDSPDTGVPPPPPVIDEPPPIQPSVLIDDAVFLPLSEEAVWYYDSTDRVTLGAERRFAGERIRPLRHDLDVQAFGDEFFYVNDGKIFYGGFLADLGQISNSADAATGRIEFASVRLVFDQSTGQGRSDIFKRGTISTEPEWQRVSLIYNWQSDVVSYELVPTEQYGLVPAVAVDMRIAVQFPYRVGVRSRTWFAPGIGIVARELAGLITTLTHTEGLPAPLIFIYPEGGALPPAQQLMYQGNAMTDTGWQARIAYLSDGEDWLHLAFDGTGSWRANIADPNLAAGLHVAQIQMSKDDVEHRIVVSVMVE